MNIQYRIVKIDTETHGVVIRYFTDKVTEMDLASSFNEDGSVRLNADGYPLSTRTDVLMSIYDTPTPSPEEVEKRIMMNAPVDWLKIQEDIKDPSIDTKMKNLRDMVGDSKSFTLDDIKGLKDTAIANMKAEMAAEETEQSALLRAYDNVTGLIDSLKVLSEKDPSFLKELSELIGK